MTKQELIKFPLIVFGRAGSENGTVIRLPVSWASADALSTRITNIAFISVTAPYVYISVKCFKIQFRPSAAHANPGRILHPVNKFPVSSLRGGWFLRQRSDFKIGKHAAIHGLHPK